MGQTKHPVMEAITQMQDNKSNVFKLNQTCAAAHNTDVVWRYLYRNKMQKDEWQQHDSNGNPSVRVDSSVE